MEVRVELRALLARPDSGYHRASGVDLRPDHRAVTSDQRQAPDEQENVRFRPIERFWPYTDLPEQPTEDELAALNPDLRIALYGRPARAFSVTLAFPRFEGDDYARAAAMARESAEYVETGSGIEFRHRARFYPADVVALRDLFEIVGRLHETEVLIDDRPVPYARELWLPLFWFLIPR
jgi:hypothetical protein